MIRVARSVTSRVLSWPFSWRSRISSMIQAGWFVRVSWARVVIRVARASSIGRGSVAVEGFVDRS